MNARNTIRLSLGILLAFVLTAFSGCGNGGPSGSEELAGGLVTGRVPMGSYASVVVRDETGKTNIDIPVDSEGRFSARVAAGRYEILGKTSDGKLSLVKQSVVVEDHLTITLLETAMVPQPGIIAVSVPLVYPDSAYIEWETDIESDGRIDYGPDEKYGYSTFTDTEMKKLHRVQILGLNPGTRYHFRVVAGRYGLDSVQVLSNDYSFVTENRANLPH
ncbi:MAG: fibronectin type III domain-containing protein [Candidatus Riflebacteria bacterium]|nr:fibronectin type III domain-containing protein [Candidatus Riflebacteria bacterium]